MTCNGVGVPGCGGTGHKRGDGCVQFLARGEQTESPAPLICVWKTLHKTDVNFAVAFISLSVPLICMSTLFIHLRSKACLEEATWPH